MQFELDSDISGKKIGVLKEGFDVCTERDVVDVVRREVERLKEAGTVVKEVSIPEHTIGVDILTVTSTQGFYSCMIKGNGGGYNWKGFHPVSLEEAVCRGLETRPQDLSGILKSFCLIGEYLDRNYQTRLYAQAQNLTMTLTKAYDRVLEVYDVLILPTTTCKASKLPHPNSVLKEQLDIGLCMEQNTSPFNSTGHPALSINAGFSEGLPVGMMIVGRQFDEATVLQVARAYEKIRDRE